MNAPNVDFTKPTALSENDIFHLLESPQDKRVRVAKMLAGYYERGGFDEKELKIAENVLRLLAQDTEAAVRKTLAEHIKSLNTVPPEIVRELAQDAAEVSIPLLEFSSLLSDEDLIELVGAAREAEKWMAVTRRTKLSGSVSEALIETGHTGVTQSLLGNEGAELSDAAYGRIWELHEGKRAMADALALRAALPVSLAERLAGSVSEHLRNTLARKYGVSPEKWQELANQAKDLTVVNLVGSGDSRLLYERHLEFMRRNNFPETFSPVLALCIGNLPLFALLAARGLKAPLMNIWYLLDDRSGRGFEAVYKRMGLPGPWLPACGVMAHILGGWRRMYSSEDLYSDLFLKKKFAEKYSEEFERQMPPCAPEEQEAIATLVKLFRSSQLICMAETKIAKQEPELLLHKSAGGRGRTDYDI